jgi:hypothetical protein
MEVFLREGLCALRTNARRRAMSRATALIIIFGIIIAAVISIIAAVLIFSPKAGGSGYNFDGITTPQDYAVFAGNRTASDGRISMTLNSYQIVNTTEVNFTAKFLDAEFVMINATIKNLGNGNATILTSFHAYWVNKSNPAAGIDGNGMIIANASLPKAEFPNSTYPDYVAGSGAVPLYPGQTMTMWLLFIMGGLYMYPPPSPNEIAPMIRLVGLSYTEFLYGGNIASDRSTICYPVSYPCAHLKVELIALNPSS